jgi:serine/threonine-protein kinase
MGRVYRVRNVISDRMDAMKVVLHGASGSHDLAARFLREIKVLAALDHPNIAALRTALTDGDQVVMVMELVDGEPLSRRLRRGPLPMGEAIASHEQVLLALAYAHERGVVHRDIKPANIMVTPDGTIKLTDFGIARSTADHALTATGTTTGSLAYMSPEQVEGRTVDARSDLYSAGIALYEMVTGKAPFRADSEFLLMSAHLQEPPVPPSELRPDVPPALDAVILRAIAKDPADRFQSAEAFRTALQAAGSPAAGVRSPPMDSTQIAPRADRRPPPIPVVARAAGAAGGAERARTWPPLLYVAAGAILVVVVAAGTGAYLRRAEAGPEAPRVSDQRPVQPAAGRDAGVPATEVPAPSGETPDTRARTTGARGGTPDRTSEGPRNRGAAAASGSSVAVATDPAVGTSRAAAGAAAVDNPGATPGSGPASLAPQAGGSAAATQGPAPQPPPGGQGARAPSELVDQFDRIAVRAASVNASLDVLRGEQARQGLGLRGDMLARQESMHLNLSRAEVAIGQGDAELAQRYTTRAQADLQALEAFLGR